MKLRSIREPTLIDLETWLNERIQASTDPYLPPKRGNNSQRNLRQDEKYKTHIHTTEIKGEPNKTTENKCSFCKESYLFYKCQSYLTMAPLEKSNSVKGKKICYNCLRDDHFTSNCNSKNTCLKQGFSAKHHTTLPDYFLLKQKKRDKDNDKHVKDGSKSSKKEGQSIKINTYKTSKVSERIFLETVPIKVIKNVDEKISTFALLDNGSRAPLLETTLPNN